MKVTYVDIPCTPGIPWDVCETMRQRKVVEWGTPDAETHAEIQWGPDDPAYDTLTIWHRADRIAPQCRNSQPCRAHRKEDATP